MKRILLCVVCSVALMSAAPAFADGPTQGAYSGPGSNQLHNVQATTTAATNTVSSGTLPFTGLSLTLLGVFAVGLIGTGLTLRSRTQTKDHS